MAEVTTGLRGLLARPKLYVALQRLMGTEKELRGFVETYIRPRPGDRVLDVGCGPGELRRYIAEDVTYGASIRTPPTLKGLSGRTENGRRSSRNTTRNPTSRVCLLSISRFSARYCITWTTMKPGIYSSCCAGR
jgi:hypothetical protein